MACNSCAKNFTLLRKEKGCPGCGFSFCSKCLDNKVFLLKLNAEAKVCAKCKRTANSNETKEVMPPDAYYKRLELMKNVDKNQEISDRLQKLKEDKADNIAKKSTLENEIAKKLKNIKGETASTSDAELRERLSKLRGMPFQTIESKPVLPASDLRSEQEQTDDLIKQYLDETKIENKYKDEFDELINDMESRLHKVKGSTGSTGTPKAAKKNSGSENEEEVVNKIVEKLKYETKLEEEEICPAGAEELPFCEICNEDATMRCLGCRYLFCKRCFLEHKDDDDGCNRYEPYKPRKGLNC